MLLQVLLLIIYECRFPQEPEKVYIGSTTRTLHRRKSDHKAGHKGAREHDVAIYDLIDKYGFESLVEKEIARVPVCCETNKDLRHRSVYEQMYIDRYRGMKDCVVINRVNPGGLHQMCRVHIWRVKHNDRHSSFCTVRIRIWEESLTDEERAEYKTRQEAAQKEALSIRMECPCGGKFSKHSKPRHLRSKKHLKWVADNTE